MTDEIAEKPAKSRRLRKAAWIGVITLAAATVVAGLYCYQRWGLLNFHTVVPGKVYRSAQPDERRLREWAQRYGIRTVVCLRSDIRHPAVIAERQAAERLGLQFIMVPLDSARLPNKNEMRRLIEVIETADRPMLIHCRAGADRTGVASVMAAMAVGGMRYSEAKKQLSARYLHLAPSGSHVGGLLDVYERNRGQGGSAGGWDEFKDWALNVYAGGK